MENEYDDLIGGSNSEIVEETEEEQRLMEAMRKNMPGYKRDHKPLVVSERGMIALTIIWGIVKVVILFLTLLFIVPFAINISVTVINALACTVCLYIIKQWWKGK
jgi:hypothetical protein